MPWAEVGSACGAVAEGTTGVEVEVQAEPMQ